MIKYAFAHPEVGRVDAHTLPEKNASTGVLEKVGMKFRGAIHDPQDGKFGIGVWAATITGFSDRHLRYLAANQLPAESTDFPTYPDIGALRSSVHH